ncbi:sucrose-phosphatase 1-like isoform X1 [Cucurbita maxima]|uniref:Sucrose-phosphatase n=1 Tax=Cucurbita maxima TaxID=3661 RepID=A0A6J1HTZ1_CUCMA|nr:sucrose-phosphatase 1-like isoform X1 [Cucurbita maxima]
MDRLDDSAKLMIVSDLDLTMVDHDDDENTSLLKFNALWEAYYRRNSLLVFSTGRSPTSYRKLRRERPLLTPDLTIMSVGTEIAYGDLMVSDDKWEQFLNWKWNRDVVVEETLRFPELKPQSETEQRPFKVSFFIEKDKGPQVADALSDCLEKRGLDVKVIYSSGIALDILPKRAGKGEALAYLLKKFKADGKVPANVLVCGDSGNDTELFSVPNVYGVMVSNAQEELLQWYAENVKDNLKITHATERCAGGIIEAIGRFQLGPNLSPRDIIDFKGCCCKVETTDPYFEVVKFYVLYERWRRGEVEKLEVYLEHLKSIFHAEGIVVDTSGNERSREELVDGMRGLYGDMKGTQFRSWVDGLSSSEIGSDSWLLKFNKWESYSSSSSLSSSGNQFMGSSTTILMTLQRKVSEDGLIWMHVHHTCLDGSHSHQELQHF